MFREMRRKKQVLKKKDVIHILENASSGVLAVQGDDGYPYAVPMSYIYHDHKIYFHSAKSGHKIDAIMKDDKVSFTVTGQDEIIPNEFTTYFSSVIVFGRARIVENKEEKMTSLKILSNKYSPNLEKETEIEIGKSFDHLMMVAIEIEHMTGKEAIELVKQR